MVAQAPITYGSRFAKRLNWLGLFVVEKNSIVDCRWTVAVSCVSPLASSSFIRPKGRSFLSSAQGMVFEASFKHGDRFAKRLKWFGLLVVEKT